MKRPFTQLEKKQLLIFTLIAFGIPYLMGIPMAFGYQRGTSLDLFANAPAIFLRVPCTDRTVCHQLCTQCTYTGCQLVGYGHQYAHNCRQSGSLGFVSS